MAIDKAKKGNKVIRAFKKVFTRKEKCEIKMKTPAGHGNFKIKYSILSFKKDILTISQK